MNFEKYKDFISSVAVGKQLPDSVYVHNSAVSEIPEELFLVLEKIAAALKIPSTSWNILKLYKRDFKVAFLNYPDFDSYSYPPLNHSYTVDLEKLTVRKSSYENSNNVVVNFFWPPNERFSKKMLLFHLAIALSCDYGALPSCNTYKYNHEQNH